MGVGNPAYKKKINIGVSSTGPWHCFPGTAGSLDDSNDTLDDTDFCSTSGDRSRILGLKDWSVSVTCNWSPDSSALTVARNAKSSGSEVFVQYLPDGKSSNGFQGPVVVESFNLSGGVEDLETVEISMPSHGALGLST